jgi:hypothetical protein
MAAVYGTALIVVLEEFFGRVQIFAKDLKLAKYCQKEWPSVAHRAYWPVNCGLRFSKNAEQPSWASRLSRTRLVMVCSKGRAALSGMSPP